AAFVVRVLEVLGDVACVMSSDGQRGCVDAHLLRPALRGDTVAPWTPKATREAIIWTHQPHGPPLDRLSDRTRAWLRRWYGEIAQRSDAKNSKRWWSLFRTDAANDSGPRVVWADFG